MQSYFPSRNHQIVFCALRFATLPGPMPRLLLSIVGLGCVCAWQGRAPLAGRTRAVGMNADSAPQTSILSIEDAVGKVAPVRAVAIASTVAAGDQQRNEQLEQPEPSQQQQSPRVASDRLIGTDKPTVWSEFGEIAKSTGAVNLGQGFPDWQPPEFVVEQAHAALREGVHQYTRPAGHPPLCEVLSSRYSRHLQRTVDPMAEVAITVGASQALYLTLQALLNPGDEVLLPEPAFDLYYGQVKLAGGTVRPVPMAVDGETLTWTLDVEALAAAAATGTPKLLILNSPHNPTGTAFPPETMEAVAAIVRAHPNLYVISDEVYKYTVYDEASAHTHFAALPGMFDRTVTLSSAGKTFSITGWQAGWCVGPEALIKPIQLLLPFVQFCVSAPIQHALAKVLTIADEPYEGHASYYDWLTAMYRGKRELLADGLRAAGMVPLAGHGGFFLMADTSSLEVPQEYLDEKTPAAPDGVTRDWALCRWMAHEAGVIAIPTSPFFSPANKHLAGKYVRFAFCKSDDTLREASKRIQALAARSAATPATGE